MESAANSVARELRELCRKPKLHPLAAIQQQMDKWRQELSLEPQEYINIGNNHGKMPLHFSAQLREDGMTEHLIALRADPNATTVRGHTPLIFASGRGRSESVMNLLKAGARSRVRIVNGDTALSMGTIHSLDGVALAALRDAEAAEVEPWLDFMEDKRAIEAQANHILTKPDAAQWANDAPPLVAELVHQLAAAAEINASASNDSTSVLVAALLPVKTDEIRFAEVLLVEAGKPSGKRRAQASLRNAIVAIATGLVEDELKSFLILLLSIVSKRFPEVSRKLAAGDAGPKQAKYAKNLATTAVMSVLKEWRPLSHGVDVATISATTSPWIAVDVLSPPDGVSLETDVAHLEFILRRLCRADSWGSDFGTALKWLRSLRPPEQAADEEVAAFRTLASAFVDGAIAACNAGQSLKCPTRRDGVSPWDDVAGVLHGIELDALHEALQSNRGFKPAPRPVKTISIDGSDFTPTLGPPFLELHADATVVWVNDAASWAHAEHSITSCRFAAVDTEWWGVGLGPALIQIAINDGQRVGPTCFLVDTWHYEGSAAAEEFRSVVSRGLLRLFSNKDLQIVGWSFSEDEKRLQELCTNDECKSSFHVVDLQPLAAAATAAVKSACMEGLAITCSRFLGKALDKTEQCSDWRRRPLTDEQKNYAALDAIALLDLHAVLLGLREDFVGG